MIEIDAQCVLLDIEGTTSSVSFVFNVLYPYAKKYFRGFLAERWDDPVIELVAMDLAREAGVADSLSLVLEERLDAIADAALNMIDRDVKSTPLKELEGYIWQTGFESGELRSHVFSDVPEALERWKSGGLDLRIFSSGSVYAQKLFFEHTEAGNLLPFFSDHFDTTCGGKRSSESYQSIAAQSGYLPQQMVFLSDVVEELDAAREAGMEVVLVTRPGNAEQAARSYGHISSLRELVIRCRVGGSSRE